MEKILILQSNVVFLGSFFYYFLIAREGGKGRKLGCTGVHWHFWMPF